MKIGEPETGHPLPPPGGSTKYRLIHLNSDRMERGQSFLVTLVEGDKKTTPAAVQTSLNKHGKAQGRKFVAREVNDHMIRVWRKE